ncbi:hypothetical protein MN116_003144 [Schistosoma mekongi]|uniref:BHLH domain-containing protein n=1 Tax=Schistosoma mekongi TaxID=38744 RepID=A0AAE1ZGS1_SCHME|nr:hypothetical protein MN116_003144 [Schistosoma mekongi]
MITPLGDMDEEFDEGVPDHHRTHEGFGDSGCLQYQSFDKSEPNWVNMLRQQGASIDATSPQTSHLSPEVHSISDLTSFDYGQRLPSLEGSSSAPISKGTSNMASHSVFAWQPFGSTPVHNQPQASSFHGQPGHLIPLIPGSTATYSGMVSSSPSSSMPTTTDLMDCHQKTNSHYAYSTNYSSSSASNKSRSIVLSPATQSGCCSSDAQNLRLGMLLPNSHSPTTVPVPIYAPSHSSTTTSSSAPHQTFCSPNSSSNSNLFSTPPVLSNHPIQDPAKAVSQKQRSKKESHNRIERKRRDYINSQIVYLSSLLPPELYRDVDGRRNKGSVLRLSVSYIMELREAVSRMESLKQENTIARQLIPLLLQRIESLEKMNSEPSSSDMNSGEQFLHSSSNNSLRSLQSLEAVYQSWLLLNEANQRSSNNSGNASNLSTSVSRHSIYPGQANANDNQYLHELMMQNETPADLDFSGSKLHPVQSRLSINVKREHGEEEERTDDCGSLCNKSDARRPGCSSRSSFTDHPASERIEEEVASQDGSFDSRPNSAYECYPHNLPRTPQSSVFLQNH